MTDTEHLEQSLDITVRLLDETVRLLAIQVRQHIATQNEAILALAEAGFGPKRIAELLGTTPNTVNVALSKARKAKRQPRQASEAAKQHKTS